MGYFVCATCSPHSTMDHALYGDKPCLLAYCSCQKMQNGKPFTKKVYDPSTYEESVKRAAERGKEEPGE